MNAIDRIVALLARSDACMRYAQSLSAGSPVAVARIKMVVMQDLAVESVDAERIVLSDGRVHDIHGRCDEGYTVSRFIVEPLELSREQVVGKKLAKELKEFPWKALTTEQLDAVLKFARHKFETSPKAKTKEAALARAA